MCKIGKASLSNSSQKNFNGGYLERESPRKKWNQISLTTSTETENCNVPLLENSAVILFGLDFFFFFLNAIWFRASK